MVQNNKFKEVVLAEALKDHQKMFIDKTKRVNWGVTAILFNCTLLTLDSFILIIFIQEEEQKQLKSKLTTAIKYNSQTNTGLTEEEELDQQLRRALEVRREQEVDRLRTKMKAVCGPNGTELKRKKI